MTYGLQDGRRGVEATYDRDSFRLTIKINGSDHWYDYLVNFLAWPRKKVAGGRVHRMWYRMARELHVNITKNVDMKKVKFVYIKGHSMGGPISVYLGVLLRKTSTIVEVINAPKAGNRAYIKYMNTKIIMQAHYDKGDIVRFFPLLYWPYSFKVKYANTKPFWKAHNNFPSWWNADD